MKNIRIIICVLASFIIAVIAFYAFFELKGFILTKEKKASLSTWVVYWDLKNAKDELNYLKNRIDTVSIFSAYYNEQNKLVIPQIYRDNTSDIMELCNDNHISYYITVVNDKIYSNGESSLKDKNLLKELLFDKENRAESINDIIKLAKEGGYEGIEIDYEGIKKDYELWKAFYTFSYELYTKVQTEGLKLRIVLEPSTPIDNIELLEGPEYIMMAYNLHGPNNEPGAKADKAFIRELAEKMKIIHSPKIIAFSTGGFDWAKNKKTKAVTEIQAKELMLYYNAAVTRDSDSGCLTFIYNDSEGIEHIVWFADGETLKTWMTTAKEEGYNNFALWRIGGNSKETIDSILK